MVAGSCEQDNESSSVSIKDEEFCDQLSVV
jgi:hypothetical protein